MVRPSIWVRSELEIESQAETSRLHAVHRNRVILCTLIECGVDILGAVDAGQNDRQLVRNLVKLGDVRAEDLHSDIAANAADHLLHAHVDRLREAER